MLKIVLSKRMREGVMRRIYFLWVNKGRPDGEGELHWLENQETHSLPELIEPAIGYTTVKWIRHWAA
jgi:hypothetical protein